MSRTIHRTLTLTAIALLALSPLAACGSGDNGTDAGADSGTKPDSGAKADSGTPDSGDTTDSGAQDTGAQDSGGGTDASNDGAANDGAASDGGGGADGGLGYNLMVVRVGGAILDGGAEAGTLTAAAAPVYLEERRSSDGLLVRTLTMPQVSNGNNQPFTLSGNSTTEGGLTRSGNGSYVVLGGYAAIPNTAAIAGTTSAGTNRVVARVDAAGNIDTTTRLDAAFSTTNIRGAASNDGTAFWASGASGASMSGGVFYVTLGQTGGTQIFSSQLNMRQVGVFGGQLYGDTQAGNTLAIFSIGNGLPTMANQMGTNLNGVTTANTTPNGFILLDLNAQVAGVDTAYVADTRAVMSGGGVQKWTYDGMTWTLKATFTQGLTSNPLYVTAAKVGADVVVVATTAESPARLVRYIDDGQNVNPNSFVLTTAQPNTVLRGVAVSPQ